MTQWKTQSRHDELHFGRELSVVSLRPVVCGPTPPVRAVQQEGAGSAQARWLSARCADTNPWNDQERRNSRTPAGLLGCELDAQRPARDSEGKPERVRARRGRATRPGKRRASRQTGSASRGGAQGQPAGWQRGRKEAAGRRPGRSAAATGRRAGSGVAARNALQRRSQRVAAGP
jgi:hypothetical protein